MHAEAGSGQCERCRLEREIAGKTSLPSLAALRLQTTRIRRPFISSCVCHGCPWDRDTLDGKTSYEWYADWFYGKTNGAASFHIDERSPNGDGTFNYSECTPFP